MSVDLHKRLATEWRKISEQLMADRDAARAALRDAQAQASSLHEQLDEANKRSRYMDEEWARAAGAHLDTMLKVERIEAELAAMHREREELVAKLAAFEDAAGLVDADGAPVPYDIATLKLRVVTDGQGRGFVKHDAGKSRVDLIPPRAALAVGRVLGFGAAKYGEGNWCRVGDDATSRYAAAALRHLFALLSGEATDHETGESHAAHAACCALFLAELHERAKGQ